jgi:hypothetical protein
MANFCDNPRVVHEYIEPLSSSSTTIFLLVVAVVIVLIDVVVAMIGYPPNDCAEHLVDGMQVPEVGAYHPEAPDRWFFPPLDYDV